MGRGVTVLFFATAREAAGCRRLERSVAATGVPIDEFVEALAAELPKLRPVLKASRLVVNGEHITARTGRLHPGDELAIHPPYSGG